MTTFDYPATLCIVHRSRAYYDCVWKSHVRVAAPAKIYQRETVPVEECAIMDFTGFFQDPETKKHRRLNMSAETNYFYSAVVGELTYSQAHSHCKGTFGSIGLDHMENLFVTESLEVVTKRVTIRENFRTGDMTVLEIGAYIPAPSWQGEGIITDF